jgi:hypothetical protein
MIAPNPEPTTNATTIHPISLVHICPPLISCAPNPTTIERNVGSNPKKDGADVAQAAEKPRKWRKIATLTENPRGDRAEFNHCVRRRIAFNVARLSEPLGKP